MSSSSFGGSVVILGASAVGKSAIFHRAIQGQDWKFQPQISSTIGASKPEKVKVPLDDGSAFSLKIWDVGGQERFDGIASSLVKNASGAIVVFSVIDAESFERARDVLLSLLNDKTDKILPKDFPMILVANKIDLPTSTSDFIADFEKKASVLLARNECSVQKIAFIKTSAKSGVGIQEVLKILATELKKVIPEQNKKNNQTRPTAENKCFIL